jgi:Glycosyl transferase family 8
MPPRCICYTTDPGYLFPTFVSATQARLHTPAEIADVAIFSLGGSVQVEKAFAQACAAENIRFLPVSLDRLDGADVMLSRLFLDRIVQDDYDQLLYIDGDTQISGSLAPLLQAEIPAGQFGAANDPMTFSLHDRGLTEYFASLGLDEARQRNYFNSGVLRINRSGWDEIGRESWALFRKWQGRSRFPDQDALNLAAMDRKIPISLAWNFPIFMRNARLGNAIEPRITHYMSNPKPWYGSFLPWGPAEQAPYLAVAKRYPALAPFLTHMSWPRKLKYKLQQRYMRILETREWGSGPRHQGILAYEDLVKTVDALSLRAARSAT